MSPAESAAARTIQKLRFAGLAIDELRAHPSRNTGDDFERSHHESFLFHLYGAIDAFLHEINAHYSCGLSLEEVSLGKLQREFRGRSQDCPELQEILNLLEDKSGFLGNTRDIRHHAMHRGGLPMAHYFNGPSNLVHPGTRTEFPVDTLELFSGWLVSVGSLTERLRASLVARAA